MFFSVGKIYDKYGLVFDSSLMVCKIIICDQIITIYPCLTELI